MMLWGTILVLTYVQLLLTVEGFEASSPVENKTEIKNNSTRRILYGTSAQAKDFPYLVAVKFHVKKMACGGSVISKNWVMTAAHCVHGEATSGIEMFPTGWKRPQSVFASECKIHEKYRLGEYEYDIALLKVNRDLVSDRRVKKINLPPPGKNYPSGTPVTIVGWGMTEQRKYPYALLQGTVYVEQWEFCNAKYIANHNPGTREMPLRTLCLQGRGTSPSGTCIGDSGGPAVTADGYVIGIGSFVLRDVNGFCMIGGPSMFVNVVDYLPWIYRHIDPEIDSTHFQVRPEHVLP